MALIGAVQCEFSQSYVDSVFKVNVECFFVVNDRNGRRKVTLTSARSSSPAADQRCPLSHQFAGLYQIGEV
jgi:hypothetical protein